MKKIIYQLLIIVLVLGTIGFAPVLASSSQQEAIDFVTSNGLWKANGDFSPNKVATRAETASVIANYLSDLDYKYSGEYADVAAQDIYAADIALATNLGLVTGAGGNFRPNDAITKQEFAVMLIRAYQAAGVEIHDTNYFTELIKDYETIGDWAKSYVTDAIENGIMVGGYRKNFDPTAAVTRGELAEAVYALYYKTRDFRLSYSVRDIDSSDDIANDFTVIDSGLYMSVGVAGVGVIARFDGAPGEIYIRRKKGVFSNSTGNLAPAVCFVRVVDPNGNTVCNVNMDYKDEGLMEKIINIPEGPAGIYQIQFIGGIHQDPVSIGIKGYKSYGVRGEDYIMFTDSIAPEGYIYVPQKVDFLNIAISGRSAKLHLYSADGSSLKGTATGKLDGKTVDYSYNTGYSISMTLGTDTIMGDTVYKYSITNGDGNVYNGFKGIMHITGVTNIVYPSIEYAMDLKSGYVMHTDEYATLQLAGPLQVRARKRMVEIYEELKAEGNEKFVVDIADKIPSLAEAKAVENGAAEAQLFSGYSHSISAMKSLLAVQCVDPSNPWFGAVITRPSERPDGSANTWTGELLDVDYPSKDWQTGFYDIHDTQHAFTGALSINSELNVYYNNPVLKKRSELMFLFLATQASADGLYIWTSTKGQAHSNGYHTYENFSWGDQGTSESYLYVRNHFSPETKAITDESMIQNADKLMNMRGQGPTNQLLMCMNGTISMYKWTGEERYHENAKRQLLALSAPCAKDSYHGQSKLGYFIESGGADGGSYGRMNEGLWCSMVWTYLTLPESRQDPELAASLRETTEHYLRWDSYFYLSHTDNFGAAHAANWTSRVDAGLGGHSAIVGNDYLQKLFPRAKKNWLNSFLGLEYKNYETFLPTSRIKPSTGTVASFICNNAWGIQHLSQYFQPEHKNYGRMYYDKSTHDNPNSYTPSNSEMYFVLHGDQQFDDSEMPILPYETEGDNHIFLEEDGLVAIKHKGLYVLCYFNNALPGSNMSAYSWMGGGPTSIWDDYFGTTLYPRKIKNFEITSYIDGKATSSRNYNYNDPRFNNKTKNGFTLDDVRHSCVLGTGTDGNKVVSGREPSKFSWIEENKSFKLSGKDYTSQKTIDWNYYLADDGITIDGGVTEVLAGEDLYMQLPIYVQKNANYTIDEENKTVTLEHNGNQIVYSWYKKGGEVVVEKIDVYKKQNVNGQTVEVYDYSYYFLYLKIKLTTASPYATVKITRTLAE